LLDNLRETSAERPRSTHEEEQGGGTIYALSPTGSGIADHLHGLSG
jgi:hypothetical protein